MDPASIYEQVRSRTWNESVEQACDTWATEGCSFALEAHPKANLQFPLTQVLASVRDFLFRSPPELRAPATFDQYVRMCGFSVVLATLRSNPSGTLAQRKGLLERKAISDCLDIWIFESRYRVRILRNILRSTRLRGDRMDRLLTMLAPIWNSDIDPLYQNLRTAVGLGKIPAERKSHLATIRWIRNTLNLLGNDGLPHWPDYSSSFPTIGDLAEWSSDKQLLHYERAGERRPSDREVELLFEGHSQRATVLDWSQDGLGLRLQGRSRRLERNELVKVRDNGRAIQARVAHCEEKQPASMGRRVGLRVRHGLLEDELGFQLP